MKKTLLLLLIITYVTPSYALTLQTLKDTLEKYCVPNTATCLDPKLQADYTNGKCVCKEDGRYWNKEDRACEECTGPTIVNEEGDGCKPIKCPDGYAIILITDGNCPSGYYLAQIQNGNCPAGYELWSYK